jgi:ribosome-associated protein
MSPDESIKRDYLDPAGEEEMVDHLGTTEGLDESRALALRIAEVIAETPAANTLVLDIHTLTPWADFFVICSGENERQLRAIIREVLDELEEAGHRPRRTEGNELSGWTLLDYGDVVVHIFDVEQRAFYRLEDRWAAGTTVLAIE